jgi:hypothetical protein
MMPTLGSRIDRRQGLTRRIGDRAPVPGIREPATDARPFVGRREPATTIRACFRERTAVASASQRLASDAMMDA